MPNKIVKKTYAPADDQILFMTQPYAAVGVLLANTGIDADANGKKIVKAGTPINGDLTNRASAFVKSPSAVSESATATVTGTGITAASVTASTFGGAVNNVGGTYEFVASVADATTTWKLGETTVTLNTYGITPTGTAADGDKIKVVYVAASSQYADAILLHDVDVTAGTENASALIFGFVDLNKLTSATQALITADVKTSLKGKVTFLK